MKSVLHLTLLNQNEVSELLSSYPEESNFNVVVKQIGDVIPSDFTEKDIIIIGFGDDHVEITDIVEYLSTAFNSGTSILFGHGNPITDNIDSLKIFGFNTLENIDYDFFNVSRVKSSTNQMLNNPYKIEYTKTVPIMSTHNTGITLLPVCKIVMDNPARKMGLDNYYLAAYDAIGKGRIVYSQFGHNDYKKDKFVHPDELENKLFINILYWLTREAF